MDIVYLKLVNGDELFAEYHGDHDSQVMISNVMVMEAIPTADDTVKYLFMSRYSPYSKLHSMRIDRDKIIFMSEVTDTVRYHYQTSLNYANQVTDQRFQDGIAEATIHIEGVIQNLDKSDESILPGTNTKH